MKDAILAIICGVPWMLIGIGITLPAGFWSSLLGVIFGAIGGVLIVAGIVAILLRDKVKLGP